MTVARKTPTITFAGANGQLELNVYKPVIAYNILQSIGLLADASRSFADKAIDGLRANSDRIDVLLNRSLMLVTALTPHIGYDKAASIAKAAHANGAILKDAAVASGYVTADEFDRWVQPASMTRPSD